MVASRVAAPVLSAAPGVTSPTRGRSRRLGARRSAAAAAAAAAAAPARATLFSHHPGALVVAPRPRLALASRADASAPGASPPSRAARAVGTSRRVGTGPTPRARRRRGDPRVPPSRAAAAGPAAASDEESSDPSSASASAEKTSYRFAVVFLVALALLLCNADRVIMSVAGVPLAEANGWGVRSLGLVQSSFLWGYTLTPLIGGVAADRYGGKAVLLGGILLWSLATACTPFAASHSLPALLMVRAAMGLGEGVALPCMNNLMARWVPNRERSRAVAACMGGFQSGSMVGLLAAPAMLATSAGVATPFLVFGFAGVAWGVVWAAFATTFPRGNRRVGKAELALIEGGGSVVEKKEAGGGLPKGGAEKKPKTPFRLLLSRAPTWACVFANFVNNWGYFILLAWMPLYFKQVLGLDLARSSYFSALPWATMAACGVFAGALADHLIDRMGVSTTTTRKITQGVGFGGPAIALLALTRARTPEQALLALTVAVGCTAFTQAGFLVNFQEIGPKYAGALHGMANTAGSLAGIVGTYGAGVILDATGSWNAVLGVTAGVYALGAAVWLAFSTGERVFD